MNDLQKRVNEIFLKNFSRTPFKLRMKDIQNEFFELLRSTDLKNLKEETGDLLCSLIQLCNESEWNFEDLIQNTLDKIERRSKQYQSLGRKKKVAILGGAFDPIHNGHIALANFVLNTSGEFDEVWLMPCYNHMYNKKMESFEDRLHMCELAAEPYGMIRVSNFEGKFQLGGETFYMVQKLLEQDFAKDEYDFSLIIGQDNANTIEKWVNGIELTEMIRFVVIPRKGVEKPWEKHPNIDPTNQWYWKKPHIYLNCETDIPEVSSTQIRESLQKGWYAYTSTHTDKKVFDYIKEKQLYHKEES